MNTDNINIAINTMIRIAYVVLALGYVNVLSVYFINETSVNHEGLASEPSIVEIVVDRLELANDLLLKHPKAEPPKAEPPKVVATVPKKIKPSGTKVTWCNNNKDCTLLAEMAYHEARGESNKGVLAAMAVTLRRVELKYYPDTIEEVLNVKNHYEYKRDGSLDVKIKEVARYNELKHLAYDMLHGIAKSPIGTIDHFHAVGTKVNWKGYVATIGNHVFYKTY